MIRRNTGILFSSNPGRCLFGLLVYENKIEEKIEGENLP